MKTKIKNICYKVLPPKVMLLVRRRRVAIYRMDMVFHPRKMQKYCPCCGIKLRVFVEGNFQHRPERFNPERYKDVRQDVLCPVCRSFPRHRILALWLSEHIGLLCKSSILYFAPEICEAKWIKRNHISCTSADLYKDADLKLDMQNTGLPEQSYDIIIANHVLEHVDDFRVALREMYRILRPNGSFICSFPMDPKIELLDEDPSVTMPEERMKRFGQNDHKRVFGMKADQFLTEAGFTVERIDGKDYSDEILPVIGPADYDMNLLFRCIK